MGSKMDQRLKDEIKALEDKNGGITAEILFNAAKKGTELYKYGEKHNLWNKDEAQRRLGIIIFRQLIIQWKVEIETTDYEVVIQPQYVRDPNANWHEQGMVNTARLRNNKESNRKVLLPYLKRAIGNLESMLALENELGYAEDIENLLESAEALLEKIRQPKRKGGKKATDERPRPHV